MSHFTCLVILPKGQWPANDVAARMAVEPLLAPYDEELPVEPYPAPCSCNGAAAWRAAGAQMLAEMGVTREELVNSSDHARMVAYDVRRRDLYNATSEEERARIDPECPCCHGSGTRMSTYNPRSTWDYYTIGGRWDGSLTTSGRNVFPMTELAPGWSVFAIVTPDGDWHARAKMGWWASTSDEDAQWPGQMAEIASAFPEHVGVLVDLHI